MGGSWHRFTHMSSKATIRNQHRLAGRARNSRPSSPRSHLNHLSQLKKMMVYSMQFMPAIYSNNQGMVAWFHQLVTTRNGGHDGWRNWLVIAVIATLLMLLELRVVPNVSDMVEKKNMKKNIKLHVGPCGVSNARCFFREFDSRCPCCPRILGVRC